MDLGITNIFISYLRSWLILSIVISQPSFDHILTLAIYLTASVWVNQYKRNREFGLSIFHDTFHVSLSITILLDPPRVWSLVTQPNEHTPGVFLSVTWLIHVSGMTAAWLGYSVVTEEACNNRCNNRYLAEKHIVTHWTTLQHTAIHCNTLRHTAARCNTIQHTAANCSTLQHQIFCGETQCYTLNFTVTHCNMLQYTATHCNTL